LLPKEKKGERSVKISMEEESGEEGVGFLAVRLEGDLL
jgi:hypothetical protein